MDLEIGESDVASGSYEIDLSDVGGEIEPPTPPAPADVATGPEAEALLDQVWDGERESYDRTVDAHVKTLRAKLKAVAADVEPIVTHRGTGYALAEDLPSSPGVKD